MNLRLDRLEALAAVYAPHRAGRLVAFAATGDDEAARRADALAHRPRVERLAALAGAFRSPAPERAAALAEGHPLWRRLAREARAHRATSAGPSTSRTEVQPADAPARRATGSRPATAALPVWHAA